MIAFVGMLSASHGQVFQATDHWPLDEASDTPPSTPVVENLIRPERRGFYAFPFNGPAIVAGESGSSPATSRSTYFRGNDGSYLQLSSLDYNTATLTFTAWVKRDGQQLAGTTIFQSSTGSRTQLEIGPNNELRYQWNGSGSGFAPSPALVLPNNEWCLVALVATPSGVTLHLRTPSGLSSATNASAIASDDFGGSNYAGFLFKGHLDDLRTYKQPLSAANIESLYQQAFHPPSINIVSPAPNAFVQPLDVELVAEVASTDSPVRKVKFFWLGASGSVKRAPYTVIVPELEEGQQQIHAVVEYGDWAYRIPSAKVSFRTLSPPPPVVTVKAMTPPSSVGPSGGYFAVTRSHTLGSPQVSFSLGGTAVEGVDYVTYGLPHISFNRGERVGYLDILPKSQDSFSEPKTITLTLPGNSSAVPGSPASATMTSGDHVTSLSGGDWDNPLTWHGGIVPPASGTQHSGNNYVVRHSVTSSDFESNTQGFFAKSIRVERVGVLDLFRNHSTGEQNVSYNLPHVILEDGGTLQFRAYAGGVNHTLLNGITNTGKGSVLIGAGAQRNRAAISGPVSGSGTIRVHSDHQALNLAADLRQLSVNSANNSYSGDWTVNHLGGGDENAALRAGAANALGTGTVRVGQRAQLINDVPGGLNSLKGVVLESDTSRLLLNYQWNSPAAALVFDSPNAEMKIGVSACYIGNLSGDGGLISGTTTTSLLSVRQTSDESFGGRLVSPLRFEKAGDAVLKLTGNIDPLARFTLSGGGLEFQSKGVTLRTLTQTAGQLFVTMESAAAVPLVTEAFASNGGSLMVRSDFTPVAGVWYPLLQYKASLSGRPPVTFMGPAALSPGAIVDYGSGTNSLIRVSFGNDPHSVWAHGFGLTGDDALPAADPDGDKMSNAEELLLGFNPVSAASKLTLSLSSMSEDQVVLVLNRVITTGSFTLESAEDLDGPWEAVSIPVSASGEDHPISVAREGTRRFYRATYQSP